MAAGSSWRTTFQNFPSSRILTPPPPSPPFQYNRTVKTSTALVIANQFHYCTSNKPLLQGIPLIYVPVEAIVTKWYGESERSISEVFKVANNLPNGAIIFLDEVDSFATARDSMVVWEAARRMLSVWLRQIDDFEQDKKVVVIAATNRKQDLDSAITSRFDSVITFGLPDHQNRQEIAAHMQSI